MTTEHRIRVICTGRGAHRYRRLTTVVVEDGGRIIHLVGGVGNRTAEWLPDGTISFSAAHDVRRTAGHRRHGQHKDGLPRPPADSDDSADAGRYFFACPSCPRAPTIADARWAAVWGQVAEAGITKVDISRLAI